MKTWKSNLEETKQRYINWWNHKGIILNMWEHFQEGVQPHAEITPPAPAKDLSQKWFDPQWRAEYLDWYVAHSSLKADILPVANTQLGPGSLAAILGGVFEGGEDTIWIHPNPDFTDEIVFNPEHPNWILHKELLKACKAKVYGYSLTVLDIDPAYTLGDMARRRREILMQLEEEGVLTLNKELEMPVLLF